MCIYIQTHIHIIITNNIKDYKADFIKLLNIYSNTYTYIHNHDLHIHSNIHNHLFKHTLALPNPDKVDIHKTWANINTGLASRISTKSIIYHYRTVWQKIKQYTCIYQHRTVWHTELVVNSGWTIEPETEWQVNKIPNDHL